MKKIDILSIKKCLDKECDSELTNRLKTDYEFVKFLVQRFKNDSSFIMNIADFYLDNTTTELESRELCIMMEQLLPNELQDKYRMMNENFYYLKGIEIELVKLHDCQLENMVGKGFWLIFDQYHSSEVILYYFARRFLKEIVDDINIEKMLHAQFKSVEQINQTGIRNYIIRFVNHYDTMLGSYVGTHLYLIQFLIEEIQKVQGNWEQYVLKDESKRYNGMLDMVHEYMSICDSTMIETELLYYIASELGILEKLKRYDGTTKLEEEYGIDLGYDENLVKYDIENSLKERLTYLRVKRIVMNQLFSDEPLDLYTLIDKKNDDDMGLK